MLSGLAFTIRGLLLVDVMVEFVAVLFSERTKYACKLEFLQNRGNRG